MFKKILNTYLGFFLLTLWTVPVFAETLVQHQERVEIPFAFSAHDTVMPAGEYVVTTDPANGTILMESRGHAPIFFSTQPVESLDTPARGKLVFRKDGEKFFLTEVWMRDNNVGRTISYKGIKKAARTPSIIVASR